MPGSSFPIFHGHYDEIADHLSAQIASERKNETSASPLLQWLNHPIQILVPSHGVADAIIRPLLAAFPGGMSGIELRTLDSFARHLVNAAGEFPRISGRPEQQLAMRIASRSVPSPLATTGGLPSMLLRSYRDIRDQGLGVAELTRRLSSVTLRNPERSIMILSTLRLYETILSQIASTDPADLLARAARLVSGPDVRAQIVFGFYDMTGAQENLIQHLARAGKIRALYAPVPLASDGEQTPYAFASRHLRTVARLSSMSPGGVPARSRSAATRTIVAFRTPQEEAKEVMRSVRALLDSGAAHHEIAIVARSLDRQRVSLAAKYASEFEIELDTPRTIPFTSHRLGRAIVLMLGLRETNFARRDVIEIVRCGLRAGGVRSRDAGRLDEATRRVDLAGGTAAQIGRFVARTETERPHFADSIRSYAEVVSELERLTGPPAIALSAAEWSDRLRSWGGLFEGSSERDLGALEVLNELTRSLEPFHREKSTLSSGDILEHLAAWEIPITAAEEGSSSILFSDVMRFRGRPARHLFVIAMQEDTFPQSRTEDPLIPDSDRSALSLRAIGDGREEEHMLFQLLLDAAQESVTFSFALLDSQGKALRPSTLLERLASNDRPGDRQEIAADFTRYILRRQPRVSGNQSRSEREVSGLESGSVGAEIAPLLRSLRLRARAGKRSSYDGFLTSSPHLLEVIRSRLATISPTRLEYFGDCPQKFLLSAILRVDEVEDPDHEIQIDARQKGTIDHTILEKFYRSLSNDDLSAREAGPVPHLTDSIARRLHELIDEEFDLHEAGYPAANPAIRTIERAATHRTLASFVAHDLRGLADSGFRPRWFEYSFGKSRHDPDSTVPGVTLSYGGAELTLGGKVDRIDYRERDRRYRILDYKSNTAFYMKGIDKKIASGHALQLPLYALAIAKLFDLSDEQIEAAILPMNPKRHGQSGFSFQLADVREAVDGNLAVFVGAILEAQFPALPGEGCRFCVAASWCRTRHDSDESIALERFENAIDLVRDIAGTAE